MTDQKDRKTDEQVDACGYTPIRYIGKGTYGIVYEASEKSSGEIFAVKYIRPYDKYNTIGLDSLNEIDILSRLHHPYIIHTARILTPNNCNIDGIAVVLPLADRTLHSIITDIRATTDIKLPILYKLAAALDFMHKSGVLHLDIKSTNVVLQGINANVPYFIDFGLSMYVDNASIGKTDVGTFVTIDHRPPEILDGSHLYNAAVDIWSFGIMMLYVLSGRNIFPKLKFSEISTAELSGIVHTMFSNPGTIPELLLNVRPKYRPMCIELLSRILNLDPLLRPTAEEICNHQLFNEFRTQITGYVDVPPISYDYAPDHRDVLKILINWLSTIYRTSSLDLFFLAIDIYNRSGSYFKTRPTNDRLALAATSLWIATKLLREPFYSLPELIPLLRSLAPNITAEQILSTEAEIISNLDGKLNVSALYKLCDNADELRLSYNKIIIDRDPTLYARVDLNAWRNLMKSVVPANNTKRIAIQDFLTA